MTNKTQILLLSDNVGQEYVARIEDGVTASLRAEGLSVRSENLFGRDISVDQLLDSADFSAVILTPPLTDDRHVLSILEGRKLPSVRIAPMLDPDRGSTVKMDEYDASRAITEHLIQKGHRRIAFLKGPRSHLVSMRRFNGYANAIGGSGQRIDQTLIAQGDFSRQSGKDQAAILFRAKPSAIFASNDEMAIGILEAAQAANIAIPGDISLVGFDGNSAAARCTPALTTVKQPLKRMGATAGALIAAKLRKSAATTSHVEVPYEIIYRDTVKDVSAQAEAAAA